MALPLPTANNSPVGAKANAFETCFNLAMLCNCLPLNASHHKTLLSRPLESRILPSLETATALAVTAPALLSGVNATLANGGKISGRVTNANTVLPLINMAVAAYRASCSAFG